MPKLPGQSLPSQPPAEVTPAGWKGTQTRDELVGGRTSPQRAQERQEHALGASEKPIRNLRQMDARIAVIDMAMTTDDLAVIASHTGLTIATVKQYIDEAHQTWQMQYLDKTTQFKSRLMARLEQLNMVLFPYATGYVDDEGVVVPPDRNYTKSVLDVMKLQYQIIRDQEDFALRLSDKVKKDGTVDLETIPTFTTSSDLYQGALTALNDRGDAGVYVDMNADDLIIPLKRETLLADIELETREQHEKVLPKLVHQIDRLEQLVSPGKPDKEEE